MNAWRLEWLRLVRTPRALALGVVFVVFGLGEPVAAKYINQILSHTHPAGGAKIIVPPPVPWDGISAYVSSASLSGLVVVVVIAAGAFAFDAKQGLATFFRTRVTNLWRLAVPRFAVNAAAAALAYVLGTIGAWYETSLLIGTLPVAGMLEGMLCGAVYLAFAVALTALAASVVRSTLGTAGLTLGLLLALPIAGSYHPIQYWLPSALVNAPVNLITGTHLARYLPGLGVAAGASVLLLCGAVARLRAREV